MAAIAAAIAFNLSKPIERTLMPLAMVLRSVPLVAMSPLIVIIFGRNLRAVTVIAGIVRHCGIALQSRDASLVSFTDPKELERVRESFLKKKLGLTDDDAALDAAIAKVGETLAGDRTENRVTVYYLLADHYDKLSLFS